MFYLYHDRIENNMSEQRLSQDRVLNEKANSIEKALAILRLFNPTNEELGTVEISKILGHHKSTTSRTLLILAKNGFLEQNPTTKKFKLGSAILSLGMVLMRSLKTDLVQIAKPHMDILRDRFQESVVLEILSTNYIVIANISEGPKRVRLVGEVGDIVPTHVAAGAKAILAFSSPDIRNKLLDQKLKKLTTNTITDLDVLMNQFDTIRKTGIAFDNGEHDSDISAIASPILNIEDSAIAAIIVAGLTKNIQLSEDSEMTRAVKETTLAISRQLYDF